jgi:glycosyltransferase involved in cell wall biosynthesis
LLAVGRLVAQKDYPTLLRALAICSRDTDCRLVVIGDGEDGPALQTLAAELNVSSRVRFLGARSDPYPFMARADALVTSSKFEGFSGVIVEALALRLPVIATDCKSGPDEILDGGRYGTLVPVGDPDRLAQAMRALLRGETRFRPIDLERRADAFGVDRGLPPYLRLLGLAPE